MSTGDVPSSNLWIPYAVPARVMSWTGTGASETPTFDLDSSNTQTTLVLGVDIVAAHYQPVQCFVEIQIPTGIIVFYDSQSTGEGLGVRFVYRGQIPLLNGEDITLRLTSVSTIDWYATAWGLALPDNTIQGVSS